MKGCVQKNPVLPLKSSVSNRARTQDRKISRPVLHPLSYRGSLEKQILFATIMSCCDIGILIVLKILCERICLPLEANSYF